MGYVKYEIKLFLPNESAAKGAEIIAKNRNALVNSSRVLKGTTNKEGIYVWESLSTGFNSDTYDFNVKIEIEGVLYVAQWSDRLNPKIKSYMKEIVLRREFLDEISTMEMSEGMKKQLEIESNGENILQAFNELHFNLKNNCSMASLTLETYILEGLIKNYIKKMNKWENQFEQLTFGNLITKIRPLHILKEGLVSQLEGLNKFRTTAAHEKGVENTKEIATVGYKMINEMLKLAYDEKLNTS